VFADALQLDRSKTMAEELAASNAQVAKLQLDLRELKAVKHLESQVCMSRVAMHVSATCAALSGVGCDILGSKDSHIERVSVCVRACV
jgi:hypothetical protein